MIWKSTQLTPTLDVFLGYVCIDRLRGGKLAQASSRTQTDQTSVGTQPSDDWISTLEQLAANLQAVTDKRVVEDMDDDERQAYESLISAYKDRTR